MDKERNPNQDPQRGDKPRSPEQGGGREQQGDKERKERENPSSPFRK